PERFQRLPACGGRGGEVGLGLLEGGEVFAGGLAALDETPETVDLAPGRGGVAVGGTQGGAVIFEVRACIGHEPQRARTVDAGGGEAFGGDADAAEAGADLLVRRSGLCRRRDGRDAGGAGPERGGPEEGHGGD